MTTSAADWRRPSLLAAGGHDAADRRRGTIEVLGVDVQSLPGAEPTTGGDPPSDEWLVAVRMPDGRPAVHLESVTGGTEPSWLTSLAAGDTIDISFGDDGLDLPPGAPRPGTPSMSFDAARWEVLRADAVGVRERQGVDPLNLDRATSALRARIAVYAVSVLGVVALALLAVTVLVVLVGWLVGPGGMADAIVATAPWVAGGALAVMSACTVVLKHPPGPVRDADRYELAWGELQYRTWPVNGAADTRARLDMVRRSHSDAPGPFPPRVPGA